jgi:hypothetical protein
MTRNRNIIVVGFVILVMALCMVKFVTSLAILSVDQVITQYTYEMMPTYSFKTTYGFDFSSEGLQRGDLVVYVPEGDYLWKVSRVIGLPGEHVEISNGVIKVDGIELEEKTNLRLKDLDDRLDDEYLKDLSLLTEIYVDVTRAGNDHIVVDEEFIKEAFGLGFSDIYVNFTLGENEYYLLTDNRNVQYMRHELIRASRIEGKITSVCKPIVPILNYGYFGLFNLVCFQVDKVSY